MLKKTLLVFVIILTLLALLFFLGRNPLLRNYTSAKLAQLNNKYDARFQVGTIYFSSFTSVTAENIFIKPSNADTLLTLKKIVAGIEFFPLLTGTLLISDISITDPKVILIKKDTAWNFNFLFSTNDTSATIKKKVERNYAKKTALFLDALFEKTPSSFSVTNFSLLIQNDSQKVCLKVPETTYKNSSFATKIRIEDATDTCFINVAGGIDGKKRTIKIRLYKYKNDPFKWPFIAEKWNAVLKSDTFDFLLSAADLSKNRIALTGRISAQNTTINCSRIADEEVRLQEMGLIYNASAGDDFIEIDSSTIVTINRLQFNPYLLIETQPTRKIRFSIVKNNFPAGDLFESLPPGLFYNLQGIKTTGTLSFNLHFFVDLAQPDSLELSSDLAAHDFRILKPGNTDFTFVNEPFIYTPVNDEIPGEPFEVGPDNPDFRSLAEIPGFLTSSVLVSEDGIFFGHKGFIPEAFRQSVAANIKEGRFVRGGSTITMQFVKNIFLTRDKTIARKLEELMITWLIENNNLCSKERMFEIYLNIIEWGPGVYGANGASRFYFSKDVSRLTLAESIFMASIVPRPRLFKYYFEKDGRLKEFLLNYYLDVSTKMLKKGWITQKDFDELKPAVELKGAAKGMLDYNETPVNPDSLLNM